MRHCMKNQITIDMIDDWAGAALQGVLAQQGPRKELDMAMIADLSYQMATEMARSRGAFLEDYGDDLAAVEEEVAED